jgi:phosphohistidine phosphatase
MKRLYLLRHAKSSWDDPALADHDRPLAPRGHRTTKLVADHLRRERIAPALVLCSPALRTRETLDGIEPALGEVPVRVERELYTASDSDLLDRLRTVPDAVQSVLLIGHNPAIQALTLRLARSGGELASVERKYPTGALATLAFRGSWHRLDDNRAKLEGFVRPSDLG